MTDDRRDEPRVELPSARDHLANERTLLAWIRTALTLIGLGFIVDRLAVQGSAIGALEALTGIALVLLGGLVAIGGAWSFLRARRELSGGTYTPAAGLDLALVGAVVVGAIAVTVFLLTNRPA